MPMPVSDTVTEEIPFSEDTCTFTAPSGTLYLMALSQRLKITSYSSRRTPMTGAWPPSTDRDTRCLAAASCRLVTAS